MSARRYPGIGTRLAYALEQGREMRILIIKAFSRMLFLLLVMAALLFIPAGTLDYWQAWTFMAGYFASSFALTVYLIRYDPPLLERRINEGSTPQKEVAQKII